MSPNYFDLWLSHLKTKQKNYYSCWWSQLFGLL